MLEWSGLSCCRHLDLQPDPAQFFGQPGETRESVMKFHARTHATRIKRSEAECDEDVLREMMYVYVSAEEMEDKYGPISTTAHGCI